MTEPKLRQGVHCKVVNKATDVKITSLKNRLQTCKKRAPVGSMQSSITTVFVSENCTKKEEKGISHTAQFVYVSNLSINKFVNDPIIKKT